MKNKHKAIILYLINFVIILIAGYFLSLPLARSFDNIFNAYPACTGLRDGFALNLQKVCSGELLVFNAVVSLVFAMLLILIETKVIFRHNKKINSRIGKDTILLTFISIFAGNSLVLIQNGFIPVFILFPGIIIFPLVFRELQRSIRNF